MAFTSSYTDNLIQQSEYYYGTPEMTPGLSGSFSGSFQGDGSQLTNLPSSGGTNLTQSIFVTQNGDDSTGTIGDISKPFATLESASLAATTGSTIFVYPGLYTVEANFNLASPGVDWYFYPNTTVSKSTAGDMFDISGFTDTGMNVWGHADFILGSSAGSLMNSINISGPTFDYTFQCRDIFSDSTSAIVDYFAPDDHSINWEFRNMSSSAASGFSQSNVYLDGLVNITCDEIISYGSCISTGNGFKAGQIRAHKLTSTNSFAVTWYAGSRLTLIVDEAVGVGGDVSSLAYRFTTSGNINIIGNTSGIQMGLNGGANAYTGVCNQTGKCTHLAVEGMSGTYNGNNVAYVVMDGTGKLNINFVNTGATGVNGYIKQSDGTINANIVNNQTYSSEITITGGTFIGDGKFKSIYPFRDITVSGGTFIWKGIYNAYVGSTNYGTQRHVIEQTGGTVKLEGTINLDGANFTTNLPSKIVKYDGGKLILDGAILTTVDTTQPTPAIYPDADRDIHIFSGGVNYNQTGSNALLNASGSGFSLTNVLGGMIIEDPSVE